MESHTPSHWSDADFDLLDKNKVCDVVGASVPTIYRRIKLGQFPPPVQPGKWLRGQIRDHLRQKAAEAAQRQASAAQAARHPLRA